MYNKKRVSILVTLLVVSIMLVGFVSANWFSDLFKIGKSGEGLEGELATQQAGAFVNVTGCPAAPQIIFVSTVSVNTPDYHPLDPTNTNFNFTAYYLGGAGGMKNPRGRLQRTGEQTRENLTCNKVIEYSTYYANYTCTVKIYHYDGPGGATWTVNTTIDNTCNQRAENSTKTFTMGNVYRMNIAPLYLNWSAVTAGPNLNDEADLPAPQVSNYGNVNMVQLSVNATNLTGKQLGGNLSSSVFIVDTTSGTCPWAKNLTAEIDINSGLSVNRGLTGDETPNANLYFCIKEILIPQVPDWFNATRQWKLNEIY